MSSHKMPRPCHCQATRCPDCATRCPDRANVKPQDAQTVPLSSHKMPRPCQCQATRCPDRATVKPQDAQTVPMSSHKMPRPCHCQATRCPDCATRCPDRASVKPQDCQTAYLATLPSGKGFSFRHNSTQPTEERIFTSAATAKTREASDDVDVKVFLPEAELRLLQYPEPWSHGDPDAFQPFLRHVGQLDHPDVLRGKVLGVALSHRQTDRQKASKLVFYAQSTGRLYQGDRKRDKTDHPQRWKNHWSFLISVTTARKKNYKKERNRKKYKYKIIQEKKRMKCYAKLL